MILQPWCSALAYLVMSAFVAGVGFAVWGIVLYIVRRKGNGGMDAQSRTRRRRIVAIAVAVWAVALWGALACIQAAYEFQKGIR